MKDIVDVKDAKLNMRYNRCCARDGNGLQCYLPQQMGLYCEDHWHNQSRHDAFNSAFGFTVEFHPNWVPHMQFSPWKTGRVIRNKINTNIKATVLEWPHNASHPTCDTYIAIDDGFQFVSSKHWLPDVLDTPMEKATEALYYELVGILGDRVSDKELAPIADEIAKATLRIMKDHPNAQIPDERPA